MANMRFVLTAQAWVVVLRRGRPAAQTLGRYVTDGNCIRLLSLGSVFIKPHF